jgi:hypothetical protein
MSAPPRCETWGIMRAGRSPQRDRRCTFMLPAHEPRREIDGSIPGVAGDGYRATHPVHMTSALAQCLHFHLFVCLHHPQTISPVSDLSRIAVPGWPPCRCPLHHWPALRRQHPQIVLAQTHVSLVTRMPHCTASLLSAPLGPPFQVSIYIRTRQFNLSPNSCLLHAKCPNNQELIRR